MTSIRRKVSVALLLVALVPLVTVGVISFVSVQQQARQRSLEALEGLAAVQEARVGAYARSSVENLALVASRTQLRLSFAAELDEPDAANVVLMERILGDAVSSSGATRRIELVDLDGRVVASSDGAGLGEDRSSEPAFVLGLDGPSISSVIEVDGERLGLHSGPVELDGERLGIVMVQVSLAPLRRVMADYTGLGETGETIVASVADPGAVQLLGDVRFPEQLDGDDTIHSELIDRALAGVEGNVSDQLDYRGEEVFAIARAIDSVPGWAVIVKEDRAEALAGANRLRNVFIAAIAGASLVVMAAAAVVSRMLTRPVIELHDAAVAVSSGSTQRRAKVLSNDELAELAIEFNRMTDELTEANARLQTTNEQLEEFVYISSHDLKSPLRSISSFGQLLERKHLTDLDEQGREYLGYIRDSAARMHGVIEDLLAYLRIEKVHHVTESVDLDAVLTDVIALHRPELDECDADVRIGDLPTVAGSAALLRQLFDNLFQNALRYRKSGRTLILDVDAEQRGGEWRITLADSGIGLAADRRDDAFTPFKRLNDDGDGTGMGLAICRRIARRHGGEVTMADSVHGGVSLVVTLPVVAPIAGSAATSADEAFGGEAVGWS